MPTTEEVPVVTPTGDLSELTGNWEVDPAHSTFGLSVRYANFTVIRAVFREFTGTLDLDGADPTHSTAQITVQTASFDSGNAMRDGHVKGEGFFDTEKYPTITFTSTAIRTTGSPGAYAIDGELTILDQTRPTTLDVEFRGQSPDMMGNRRLGFTATGTLPRSQWGLTWNAPVPGGGMLLAEDAEVTLEVSAVPEGTNARMQKMMDERQASQSQS